jgi:hypothetical protein
MTGTWNEHLHCPVCYDIYNITDCRPKVYGCGHSCCELCVKRSRSPLCPICRARIISTSVNFQLLDFVRVATSLGLISDELSDLSPRLLEDLMVQGSPLTFVTTQYGIQSAITLSTEGFLNSAGRKLTLEPYSRSDTRQIFSFRFDHCLGAIASHHCYGIVLDVADVHEPVHCPVYGFMFHGQQNQQFQYRDRRLYSISHGKFVTFNRETKHFSMAEETRSPLLIQEFGIIRRDC